jgi:maltose O-acetyltransferase
MTLQERTAGEPVVGKTIAKLQRVAGEELDGVHPRLLVARMLAAPLPRYAGSRLRTRLLRLAGFRIGHGTVMWDMPIITGSGDLYHRLTIGELCRINIGCVFELGEQIMVGDYVGFGHQVMVLTTTHEIGPAYRRSMGRRKLPVTIGNGCWIGARVTILPGVTIGSGSIIAAGAVVNRDVPPNTLSAGVPAKVVKELDAEGGSWQ